MYQILVLEEPRMSDLRYAQDIWMALTLQSPDLTFLEAGQGWEPKLYSQ